VPAHRWWTKVLALSTDVLDPTRLLAAAREATGLDDFADDGLADRLGLLAAQVAERLDPADHARAAAVLHGLLTLRLNFFDDRRRLPIADERVERPIIVMGEARSGTTVLQMLLGCDPESRLLEFWELMRPSPPPGVADTTQRRAAGDDDWREILELIPTWLISHPYNGMLGRNPPECERTWAMDLRAMPPSAWWRVPVCAHVPPRIELPVDHERQYQIHKMTLQHLQHARPHRRWVLKGVSHQLRLKALLEAYPDAIFVWIHRDPLQALASRFELHVQIYEAIVGQIDRKVYAQTTIDTCTTNFDHAAATPLADDPRIQHLLYKEFTGDPVRAVRGVYERAGLTFTPGFEAAMHRWLAENPSNRYGRFAYSVDALGVDVEDLDRRLDAYRERFGVPREVTKR
jgi:hypothetical protein